MLISLADNKSVCTNFNMPHWQLFHEPEPVEGQATPMQTTESET